MFSVTSYLKAVSRYDSVFVDSVWNLNASWRRSQKTLAYSQRIWKCIINYSVGLPEWKQRANSLVWFQNNSHVSWTPYIKVTYVATFLVQNGFIPCSIKRRYFHMYYNIVWTQSMSRGLGIFQPEGSDRCQTLDHKCYGSYLLNCVMNTPIPRFTKAILSIRYTTNLNVKFWLVPYSKKITHYFPTYVRILLS